MSMSRLSVLSDLQEYQKENEAGNVALKKSLWQITTLRRKQMRGLMTMEETFSAEQIREELRARTLVRDRNENSSAGEPGLISEGSEKKKSSSPVLAGAPEWVSVDALEEKVGNKENPGAGGPTATSGLRQRKKKGKELGSGKSKVEEMTEDPIVDEEVVLLQRDPLELFSGVRPGDLKKAQENAKVALDSYIEAASRAARILHQLNRLKGETK